MRKPLLPLLILSAMVFVSCGGGGGGISGSPDQPPAPVSVSIVEASATLEAGDTFQFHASVNNATNTTMTWTVNDVVGGNSTVGTMSLDGLYTAPAGVPSTNPVTVKATSNADKSKSDTAMVTINPKFAVSPASASVKVGETQQFTANQEVDVWRVNDILWGSNVVGTVSSTGLYTAPATVPSPSTVTVTAIEKRDGSKFAAASVAILGPTTFAISPTAATVAAGATQQFTVAPSSADVIWEVSGAAGTDAATWGTISTGGLYTAPVTPPWTGKVNIKVTSKSDSTQTANAVVTVVFSNATMNGHYAFRYRYVGKGDPSLAVRVWAIGSFVADGKGGISGGVRDSISYSAGTTQELDQMPFTGTYSIGADGRANATLTLLSKTSPPAPLAMIPLRWVMISNTSAQIIGFEDTGSGWGRIDIQDPSSFSARLSGPFVFSFDGLSPKLPTLGAGMFIAVDGVINSGSATFNQGLGGASAEVRQTQFDGSYTSVDPLTGRGTLTIAPWDAYTQYQFVFYQLNSQSFILSMQLDPGALGVAVQQDTSTAFSNNSLSGNLVLFSTGYVVDNGNLVAVTAAGRLTADGSGNLTNGVVDINGNGNLAATGTYSISPSGEGTVNFIEEGTTTSLALYMISAQQFVYISTSPTIALTGQFMPQASGTYNASTLHGSFAIAARGTLLSALVDGSGQMTADGSGNLSGKADLNAAGTLGPDTAFTGTYTISGNGRGQVTLNLAQLQGNFAIYLVSGRTAILVPIDPGAPAELGLAYRQF